MTGDLSYNGAWALGFVNICTCFTKCGIGYCTLGKDLYWILKLVKKYWKEGAQHDQCGIIGEMYWLYEQFGNNFDVLYWMTC